MIQKIVKKEITGTSHPFATAYKKCRFDENGKKDCRWLV